MIAHSISKFIRVASVLSLFTLLASPAFGALLTGFEASEGFENGDTSKTIGEWALPTGATITDATAFAGTQSLRSKSTGIINYSLNGTLGHLGGDYNFVSFSMKAESFAANTQIGFWQVLFGSTLTESRIEIKVSYGATALDPIKVEYIETYYQAPTPTYKVVYLDDIDLTQWNTVSFGIDFSEKKYQIQLGDSMVAPYENLAATLNATPRVTRLYLRGSASVATYYDQVSMDHAAVVPEPGAALLLLPGVGLLLCLKRRRGVSRI